MKYINYDKITLLIYSLCFLLITIALFELQNFPASGYESSIYKSTPLYIILILFFVSTVDIFMLLNTVYLKRYKYDNYWMLGLLLIFIIYTIFSSLYVLRGYYAWNLMGDSGTHLKYIINIIDTSNIPSDLFYPIIHIYTSEFSMIANLNPLVLLNYIPIIFGVMYLLFMYIFSRSILNKGQSILVTLGSAFFTHQIYVSFAPYFMSSLSFPLVFYVIYKNFNTTNISWRIILLILVLLYPPFHPVPTITLGLIIFAFFTISRLFVHKSYIKLNITLILLIWGILWLSSFSVWSNVIINIVREMADQTPSNFELLNSSLTHAQFYGYSANAQILRNMGGTIIYFLSSLIVLPYIWSRKFFDKTHYFLFSLYGALFALSIGSLAFLLSSTGFLPMRMIIYINIITTVFFGYLLYYIIEKLRCTNNINRSKMLIFLIGLLLIGIHINGFLALYPSPFTLKQNYQATIQDIEGSEWLIYNRNVDIEVSILSTPSYRFSDFILASSSDKTRAMPRYLPKDLVVPFHFGYDSNSTLYNYYKKPVYLTITKMDRLIYSDIYPEIADLRWLPEDFNSIDLDQSVNSIYSNGEFNTYYIDGSLYNYSPFSIKQTKL